MGRVFILCAALLLVSTEAQALCRDDLKDIKPRIDQLKNSNKERYGIANRWWILAQEAEKGSEVDCINYYVKVRKALSEPLPQVNNCLGANAYLPGCARGGAGGGAYGGPGAPGAGAGFALGGGGAFTPPGAVGAAGQAASPP